MNDHHHNNHTQNQPPSSFPTHLPDRPQTSSHQTNPNPYNPANHLPQPTSRDPHSKQLRYCWAFSLSSYDPRTSDKSILLRRTCMIITLAVRTAVSIFMVIKSAVEKRWVNLGLWIFLGMLGFAIIAWCLAVIGECRGTRRVLKVRVTRSHWDIILVLSAVVAVATLAMAWFVPFAATSSLWYGAWLFLVLFAWIATWRAEEDNSVV